MELTQTQPARHNRSPAILSIAALGVVFGDIGTSPLYAFRQSLLGLPINHINVLGVLSLIFWSLAFVISVKYLVVIFKADNEGEGGILALFARLRKFGGKYYHLFFMLAIFGSGLLLGDGMLTPAISVLSAIEGLKIIAPSLSPWVWLLATLILIVLYSVQSLGTAKIGFTFGPLLLIWFIVIGVLGIVQIVHYPIVLEAINPYYAYHFFIHNGWKGYAMLGGVFLVMTGGEALYADLGHFGKTPIRLSWFFIVLPALLMNYLGQGAYLLMHPEGIANPFYGIVPIWFFVPTLIIASIATIIASQAIISAIYSLTNQAVLLGLYPHLPIVQTSAEEKGQVYVPQMNTIAAIGTIFLIFVFRSSNALADAYGIAVNLVMVLTTSMVIYFASKLWKWGLFKILLVFSPFLIIDLMFLGANIQKLETGGWMPVVFALVCGFIMLTWHKGMAFIRDKYYISKEKLVELVKELQADGITRLPNTTMIFITDIYEKSGAAMLRFLRLSRALPENILILSYVVETVPIVPVERRFELNKLASNIDHIVLHYGFMDFIDVPAALSNANQDKRLDFLINLETCVYLLEIPNVIASRKEKSNLFFWQEKLFSFLTRNYSANLNIEFYQLPFDRTMAIGTYNVI
jgi:KUP system potassium uptake protein